VHDPGEKAAVARTIEWLTAGASWYRIARELLHDRIATKDGRDWSPSRVRRAHLRSLRVQDGQ
jgi:hypothetical protein